MAFGRKKSEDPDTSATAVSAVPPPAAEPAGESPLSAQAAANGAEAHPEILVGAAFVGGFALAQIMKRFRR